MDCISLKLKVIVVVRKDPEMNSIAMKMNKKCGTAQIAKMWVIAYSDLIEFDV